MKFLMFFLLLIPSCVNLEEKNIDNKTAITYYSDMANSWRKEKLKECQQESIKITLFLYESRMKSTSVIWTKEEVKRVEKFILDNCVKHRGLTI